MTHHLQLLIMISLVAAPIGTALYLKYRNDRKHDSSH